MLEPYLSTDAYRRRFFEPLLRTNHPMLSAAMSSQRWPTDQPLSRVLAVDDDILMRMLLSIYMKRCDCSVDIVGSVSQALLRLTRQRYSLIIVDGHLGDGSACDIARFVRRQEHLADVPIVAISSDATADHVRRLTVSGVDQFLPKPISTDQIRQLLEYYSVIRFPTRSVPAQ